MLLYGVAMRVRKAHCAGENRLHLTRQPDPPNTRRPHDQQKRKKKTAESKFVLYCVRRVPPSAILGKIQVRQLHSVADLVYLRHAPRPVGRKVSAADLPLPF
jgi:hypothetical protein